MTSQPVAPPSGETIDAEALFREAEALAARGTLDVAADRLTSALALRPDFIEASFALAEILWLQGKLELAAERLRDALKVMPGLAEAHNNLGLIYSALHRYGDAAASYRSALAIRPDVAWLHCNLGNAFAGQRRFEAAIASYRQALALDPRHAESYLNLANVLKEQGDLDSAVANYRRAANLRPENVETYLGLGSAMQLQGRLDAAIEAFRQALARDPENAQVRSGVLFTMNVDPSIPPDQRLDEARRYGSAVTRRAKPFTRWAVRTDRSTAPTTPLRVGVVSGDLRLHPVGFFIESVLEHLDPSQMKLVAYATTSQEDALTERIKPRFAAWHDVSGLDDEAAANVIHRDGVDILIDLAGHTAHNRLPIFAWKPAPVQVTWLGYFATTGVNEIDYLLADRASVPESERDRFTEAVAYLPDSRFCFTPPAAGRRFEPSSLPAIRTGRVTFGCFQNLLKLNDAVLGTWGRILRALPDARLRIQNAALGFGPARAELQDRLQRAGIAPDRLGWAGPVAREEYLLAHADVDIILDTFPYTGATTTCEALWMGVPTLTVAGDTLLSRQGSSLLRCVGLDDWIAEDQDDYVKRSIAFASDRSRLAQLRSSLRERLLASPLCDARRFARNLEAALLAMWERKPLH